MNECIGMNALVQHRNHNKCIEIKNGPQQIHRKQKMNLASIDCVGYLLNARESKAKLLSYEPT